MLCACSLVIKRTQDIFWVVIRTLTQEKKNGSDQQEGIRGKNEEVPG